MMDAFDLASKLFGNSRAESRGDVSNSLDILTAMGAGDSGDGAATVYLDADVTPADDYDGDDYAIGIPTSPNVIEGDGVLVGLTGSGPLKTPVVISNPGSGDRMQVQVDNAETLAQQAEAVAQEAAAEVEQVRQDVTDFRDDVATTYATKVEREDGDDAVKTWVTTNYTNSNDLATTYATKTLVSQTKDAIELAASQTYETQSDAAATYATKSALTVGLDGIRSEVAEDYQPKGDYATTASMNSAIQQSASSIESSVAATYLKQSDASTTYATKTEVTQTASALDTRITTAQSTADGAYLERTATGTTIDTTGAATIRSLVVEGQSVQDGTPTPSAPVPIVSVESRNLLPAYSATTVNGITFTVDGSGAVTANGTASATVNHYVLLTVPETGAYVMSGCPAGGSASTYQLWTYDMTTPRDQQLTDTGSGATGTLTKGHIISVRIRFQSGYTATNLTFRPMLERGTAAHDYQPYGTISIVSHGKNLLDPLTLGEYAGGSISKNGQVTYSGDTVTATNMTANSQLVGYSIKASAFRETTLTVTATSAISTCVCYWQWRNGTTKVGGQNSTPVPIRGGKAEKTFSITIPDNVTHMFFGIGTLSGGTYTMSNVQLELGSTATEYEPYQGTTTPIDLQGHALRSLPDGTHDEMRVDSLGRVTMTQRVGVTTTATTDGISATVGTDAMSTTGDLSDGATVIYPLATPQTIDLGTIDLPTPADTLWLDAAIVPTIDAAWWTVDGIAGQQALDAEVTERQTLIRQFSGGVLAGYVGNAIAALVNAAGSFDVVQTAWTDGVPSILGTLATFGANLIRIGGKFASSGRSTAKVQFFEDNSALTDLTAEHYIDTTTEPQVSHDLALSSTVTDDELPDGTSRTVTGNVEVWEQIYNDGTDYSDQVTASLNGATTNRQYNASVGVDVIEASGGQVERTAFAVADNLRLTHGTGSQVTTADVPMEQAIAVLSSPVTLFTGTYAQTHSAAVTLSETAANFSRIEFICENNDGERTSVTVTDPNGKHFNVVMVTIAGPSGTGTYVYMKAKSFSINGTSVTCRTYTYNGQTIYRHGSVTLRNGVAVAATQASEEIGIVKVLGWR